MWSWFKMTLRWQDVSPTCFWCTTRNARTSRIWSSKPNFVNAVITQEGNKWHSWGEDTGVPVPGVMKHTGCADSVMIPQNTNQSDLVGHKMTNNFWQLNATQKMWSTNGPARRFPFLHLHWGIVQVCLRSILCNMSTKNLNTSAGCNLSLPDHKIAGMCMVPIERVRPENDPFIRLESKSLWAKR